MGLAGLGERLHIGGMVDAMDLRAWFQSFGGVPGEALEVLLGVGRVREYARGALITPAGEVQRDLLLIESGIQMSWHEREGRMHVMAFTYAPSVSGVPDSFFFQRPSRYHLQALTETRCRAISFEQLQALMAAERCLETLFRRITEAVLAGMIDRHLELQTLSMEERFRQFAARSPHLLLQVPHKYLASYLDIDPTNFSKLYNRIRI